jgi:sulfur-oxidizing protein SoxY
MKKAMALTALVLFASGARAQTAPESFSGSWPDVRRLLFKDAAIVEDEAFVSLDAPARAEDAALTPIRLTIHAQPGDARRVVKISLVIDENPVPLAGEFTLGAKADITQIATRVRVNAYTNMHAVAQLSDGSLHMTKSYVKAAGGCSAPVAKNLEAAEIGAMKLRVIDDEKAGRGDYVVMMRHPNNSGLQMDQVTRLYTPARYVDHLAIYQGDELVFSVEGGISLSEDPNFRFDFARTDARTLRVEAHDIDNARFQASWPIPGV